jgi:hypothetical protein
MSRNQTLPPQSADEARTGPSIRRLDDDPRRVFASFVGHLERVAAPAPRATAGKKPPKRKGGAA